MDAKFTQIATAANESDSVLYALDESGRVWRYDSEWVGQGPAAFFWTPLSSERRELAAVRGALTTVEKE
jgi:hypothetical protein